MSGDKKRIFSSSLPVIQASAGYAFRMAPEPGTGRTFTCPHLSVGNALSAFCEQCGELEAAA